MEPIRDRNGRVVAWLNSDVIVDLHGIARAFARKDQVINYSGRHLGRMKDGFFRDLVGAPVAYMRGASGGPLIPVSATPPVPPVPPVPPMPPVAPVPPVAPMPTLAWGVTWDEFMI